MNAVFEPSSHQIYIWVIRKSQCRAQIQYKYTSWNAIHLFDWFIYAAKLESIRTLKRRFLLWINLDGNENDFFYKFSSCETEENLHGIIMVSRCPLMLVCISTQLQYVPSKRPPRITMAFSGQGQFVLRWCLLWIGINAVSGEYFFLILWIESDQTTPWQQCKHISDPRNILKLGNSSVRWFYFYESHFSK